MCGSLSHSVVSATSSACLSVELVLLVAIINYCCIFSVSELPSLLLDSGDTLHVSICIFLYLIILCLE